MAILLHHLLNRNHQNIKLGLEVVKVYHSYMLFKLQIINEVVTEGNQQTIMLQVRLIK